MRSVYLMKTSHDLYKVGVARDVNKRIKGLQTSNGSKVLLVTHAFTGNALKLENTIHVMLREYRQPGGREWFKLSPEQALRVCIYIHQQAEYFYSEDEIRQVLSEYAILHENLVTVQKGMETVTGQIGSDIQKAIGQLRKYKPLPKVVKKSSKPKPDNDKDIFNDAMLVIKEEQGASTSMLQRRLRISYGRAARLIQELEGKGIVGPADGSRRRELLVTQ